VNQPDPIPTCAAIRIQPLKFISYPTVEPARDVRPDCLFELIPRNGWEVPITAEVGITFKTFLKRQTSAFIDGQACINE
jgi:hypothetical protein